MFTDLAILNVSPAPTGFGRYAIQLASAFPEARLYSFILFRRDEQYTFPGNVFRGVYPLKYSQYSGALLNTLFFPLSFRKPLREVRRFNVIHFLSQEVPPFEVDSEKIVTVHDLFALEQWEDSFYRRAYNWVVARHLSHYRKYEHVITVSEHMKRKLLENGFGGKIHRVYSPVSPSFSPLGNKEELRRRLSLPEDKKLVLSISTRHARKNIKTVLETMEKLGSSYELIRVGEHIGKGIALKPADDRELNAIYNACDVLLIPSLDEGFGYPVVEAFAAGLPVVASDIEVFREVAGDAAVLVEPSAEACSRGVREAIAAEGELKLKGLARARLFSGDSFSEEMKRIYSSL